MAAIAAPPIQVYATMVLYWLHHAHFQGVFAFIAFAAGICMIINGEQSFKATFILLVSLVAALTARYDLEQTWEASNLWHTIAGVEVGLLAGVIAYYGYEGTKWLMGSALGVFFGVRVHLWLSVHFHHWTEISWFVVVTWTVCMVLGILMFTQFHHKALSFIAPIFGGWLVSSAVGYAVASIVRMRAVASKLDSPALQRDDVHLVAEGDTWVDFFGALIGTSQIHVGVLGQYHVKLLHHELDLDKILGTALWIVMAFVGITIHKKNAKSVAASNSTAKGDLREPLMPKVNRNVA